MIAIIACNACIAQASDQAQTQTPNYFDQFDPDGDWVLYGKGAGGSTHKIHAKRVKRLGGGEFDVWTKTTYASDQLLGAMPYRYAVLNQSLACSTETSVVLSATYYAIDGKVVAMDNVPSKRMPTVPDSIGEALLKTVCPLSK